MNEGKGKMNQEFIKVLLIEDNPGDRRIVQEVLSKVRGVTFNLECADRLSAGLECLADKDINVVLLDLGLPDSQGLDTLDQVKAQEPRVPVVVMTGLDDEELALKALQSGAQDYQVKGQMDSGMLSRVIRYAIERKRSEERLRESEEKLRRFMDSATDNFTLWDSELNLVDINDAALKLFPAGTKKEDVIGKHMLSLSPNLEETDRYEKYKEVIKTGKAFYTDDFVPEVNDRNIHLALRAFKVGDGMGMITTDITERKLLEQQARQAQKMEAVGTLAGGIAHEFNNILSVILSYSGFVKEDLPGDDSRQEDIKVIEKAARRAADLTRSLLAFSRQQLIIPKPIDLNNVISGIEERLKKVFSDDIDLIIKLDENLGIANTDRGQIEQVIMNLVVNARDAMPRGGSVTIETSNVVLDENYANRHEAEIIPGPYVMLAISDTGHGMTEEVREHIFEPFFTTKEVDKGTGLGLATVYGIVKQSNGYIWVYSEPGMGSTFKIYLPTTEWAAEEVTEAEQFVSPPMGGETVLLVEDDEGMRKATTRILSNRGYKVFGARDPIEAEEKFKEADRIDLLLTDVIMPHGNGHELAQRLTGFSPQLKVLYMSGYSDDIIAYHGMLDKNVKLMQKPFPAQDLLKQVREILDNK